MKDKNVKSALIPNSKFPMLPKDMLLISDFSLIYFSFEAFMKNNPFLSLICMLPSENQYSEPKLHVI